MNQIFHREYLEARFSLYSSFSIKYMVDVLASFTDEHLKHMNFMYINLYIYT